MLHITLKQKDKHTSSGLEFLQDLFAKFFMSEVLLAIKSIDNINQLQLDQFLYDLYTVTFWQPTIRNKGWLLTDMLLWNILPVL